MHVTVLAIVEIRIGTPNSLEHFDAEAEGLNSGARIQETQSRVAPRLPEVAIHRVILAEGFSRETREMCSRERKYIKR